MRYSLLSFFFFHHCVYKKIARDTKMRQESIENIFNVHKIVPPLYGQEIGEYHRHLHLYLAGCLTWRKLENTGYRPNLSILRANIVACLPRTNVHISQI